MSVAATVDPHDVPTIGGRPVRGAEWIAYVEADGTWHRGWLWDGQAEFFFSTRERCYFDFVGECWNRRIYRERDWKKPGAPWNRT